MYVPSLAEKAALSLFYNGTSGIDFLPYENFASIIQKSYRNYILRVRAIVYIQKMFRGFSWRQTVFDFRGSHSDYISRIVEKLRPEWPIRGWNAFIDRGGNRVHRGDLPQGIIPWSQWAEFYDTWNTAFCYYHRPKLATRRMDFHASLFHSREKYRLLTMS
tara:strand:+ start:342 stop:824 length:483 start_codon:yes stop_codon:yes gene_type:complete